MFSKENVNTGRQLELDIARGLAILFMIFIHGQIFFANASVSDSYFGAFNDFVGMVPAAPMFMFLLGVGIVYSRKSDYKLLIKRGILLIATGYLLNFLKGFIPEIINAYRSYDITYLYYGITELLYIDILHFSGLALIMFGLFKKFKANLLTIGFFGIMLGIININFINITIDNFWISSLLGFIWGCGESSYFPFLTWALYPILGYIFGSFLIRCTNKKKFYIILFLVSAIIFICSSYLFNVYLEIPSAFLSDNNYYHHILTDNITFTSLIIFELSVISLLVNFIPKFLEKIFIRWSKHVTQIFFIHWILLTWTTLFIENNSLSMLPFILLLIVIIILSDFLAYLYSNYKLKRKKEI